MVFDCSNFFVVNKELIVEFNTMSRHTSKSLWRLEKPYSSTNDRSNTLLIYSISDYLF